MNKKTFRYIYGPVPSWRLGNSLGIDLLSQKEKVCNFDCVYCQLGKIKGYTQKRKLYIPTREIIKELKMLPKIHIDYITFSGRGEPTLALNLGKTIKAVKKLRREPIAVLTNSTLTIRPDVRKELCKADLVVLKFDACSQKSLEKINRPAARLKFKKIFEGIRKFKNMYTGKLALQIMFVNENENDAVKIAEAAHQIHPDEIQINTPLRPSAVKPLSLLSINKIKKYFKGLNAISVYNARHKKVKPISSKDTLRRRGKII